MAASTTTRICTINGCQKPANASRGWCWQHYGKFRRHGDPLGAFQPKTCSVSGCLTRSRIHGMCDMHYRRFKAHGDPSVRLTTPSGPCVVDGCGAWSFGHGLCRRHHHIRWMDAGGAEKKAAARGRRRALIAGLTDIDPGLSWRTLWDRGDRDCYLCCEPCEPADTSTFVGRDGYTRTLCGNRYPTLDHIVPLSRGGRHTLDNAALACKQCNCRKGTRTIPTGTP